ncbi:MAG: hypothetical protein E2O39_04665 [Planctomycetota bacterium]|nr:MAG: hypothetical protein E2O39_04665 [Planctomycetota bacterium]
MCTIEKLTAGAAVALLAGTSLGQGFHLNEIYASHSGTDDQEHIEIIGTPGASLDSHFVLIVEGDLNSSCLGCLDRAWDLSGFTMPADGYFVLGDTAVPTLDFDLGLDNTIENGTETFYLVTTSQPAVLMSLLGTDVDPDGDLVTSIVGVATIIDIIAMIDGDATDHIYDGAAIVGPDGPFLPAGIFRDADYPGAWCGTAFLDFDDVANQSQPRTPGSMNVACGGGCGDGAFPGNYCLNTPFSTGLPSMMSANQLSVSILANNLTISANNLPPQPGQFIGGAAPAQIPFQNGFLCIDPSALQRLLPITTASAAGVATIAVDFLNGAQALLGSGPINVIAGTTHYFQRWNRDPGVGTGSNLSDGIGICIFP